MELADAIASRHDLKKDLEGIQKDLKGFKGFKRL